MRESPVTAVAFIVAMIVIPTVIFYAIAWGALRYTKGGILFNRSILSAPATTQADANPEQTDLLQCSYFTGNRVVEREYPYARDRTDTTGSIRPRNSCPLWVRIN